MLKKLIKHLTSLKFGIILFLIIAIYSLIGTIIPQGLAIEHYLHRYETFGSLMVALEFHQVYSSIIFKSIMAVFIVNLLGCTLNILPGQLKRMKNTYISKPRPDSENLYDQDVDLDEFKEELKKKRFNIVEQEKGYYAVKHRIGNIGSSITHLGIVIIVLGGFIGNLFAIDGSVDLMPGEEATFHDNNFSVVVDDFYMEFRDDNSISQYFSEVSVYEDGIKVKEDKIWVNNPLSHNGLHLYQSYYGWINKLEIKDQDGNVLSESVIGSNKHYFYEPENLRVFLHGFYPDFTMNKSGNPVTRSQRLVNPHFAVMLYDYDEHVGSYIVKPGHEIPYNDINVHFLDPILYTGITYRQDYGYYYVLIGCLLLVIGLMLSFYFYPKYIYVTSDSIIPITRQNSWGYSYQIKNMLKEIKSKGKGDA